MLRELKQADIGGMLDALEASQRRKSMQAAALTTSATLQTSCSPPTT